MSNSNTVHVEVDLSQVSQLQMLHVAVARRTSCKVAILLHQFFLTSYNANNSRAGEVDHLEAELHLQSQYALLSAIVFALDIDFEDAEAALHAYHGAHEEISRLMVEWQVALRGAGAETEDIVRAIEAQSAQDYINQKLDLRLVIYFISKD